MADPTGITSTACGTSLAPPPRGGGPGPRRGRRLKTSAHVRAALAHLYRELELGRADLTRARVMVYCAATLASVIQTSDLEERVAALEAQLAARPQP